MKKKNELLPECTEAGIELISMIAQHLTTE